ncbi:tRNA-specific 2-thiouridylase mnmA [Gossypium arboreum]|uniref:tRNA-specific 2-thiouridylase mnmA n=1 Tax=Gossypium arboreum TaxID=29729 RepID=A0A0B0PXB1_GOSAR|nr:tRNA-specific 2-thiouridylase mnmA [Gossypium arboreum]
MLSFKIIFALCFKKKKNNEEESSERGPGVSFRSATVPLSRDLYALTRPVNATTYGGRKLESFLFPTRTKSVFMRMVASTLALIRAPSTARFRTRVMALMGATGTTRFEKPRRLGVMGTGW